MKRFVAGADRAQSTLLPESLDDWVDESNPVRVIDAFVDALNVAELGFEGVEPAATGQLLSSFMPLEALHLWLPQPGAVEPAAGTRGGAQRRGDVAAGSVGAGPQDDCGLPQGQRQCHQEGLCAVRRAVPPLCEHSACQAPRAPFFFSFFLSSPFSCLTAPQAFSCPDRVLSQAGARRCCQGWPLLQRPPPSGGPRPLQQSSTTAGLMGRGGRLHSCLFF